MTENVRVYNPNAFEVVIDLEGHALDGGSATDVGRDTLTDHLIDTGQLLIQYPEPVPVESVVEEVPAPPAADTPKPKQRRTSTEATGNGSENRR
ncbi:hypothetical protein SEA_ROSIEPOSIE_17 [Arthrobacter phage RosiePosie]|uniref:Uncharacterized protein n=14 Tax=Klausavirus princesstrina TaxID=1984784 RepID=A0A286N430_9CAUD|nr:hypothetical protein FDI82_gp017 [Arthrobacter phage PrincessTrina]ANU79620.1 hypothetical protein SEA_CONBOY_17 [Arthrobacter phage Conboy]AOZ64570.1 hypothetical protein SEA_CHUBSTER_17 [Arthrobacter phage Chubster]AOZ64682.1 hypothetical protein SEA_CHOCOLAT_17 [Arthrobacter phage Chocolat]APC44701.1 hypothetical protein SEA_EDGARPOE_17 [Arthrobacter phage EdgarPoe]APC44812.1 hypothetical protein SEA_HUMPTYDUMPTY_17 [Arthrobacter phage HumptyDumpty]ASX98802.1 hypothetical protein SEA_KA